MIYSIASVSELWRTIGDIENRYHNALKDRPVKNVYYEMGRARITLSSPGCDIIVGLDELELVDPVIQALLGTVEKIGKEENSWILNPIRTS